MTKKELLDTRGNELIAMCKLCIGEIFSAPSTDHMDPDLVEKLHEFNKTLRELTD